VESREFALYNYQAGGNAKNLLIVAAIAGVILAVFSAATFSRWGLLFLLLPAGIIIHLLRAGYDKALLIGNRYLILGSSILYFANVASARLDKAAQTLTLVSVRGRRLVIAAEKFPTNARKTDKIRINRTAKFEKVTEKIIARLKAVSPGIEIS